MAMGDGPDGANQKEKSRRMLANFYKSLMLTTNALPSIRLLEIAYKYVAKAMRICFPCEC